MFLVAIVGTISMSTNGDLEERIARGHQLHYELEMLRAWPQLEPWRDALALEYETNVGATTSSVDFDMWSDILGLIVCVGILGYGMIGLRRSERRVAKANETLAERVVERTEALARSQEQLLQAQKMEAVGRLAGGIAHDFNNLLTVILGHTELLGEELTDETMRADALEIKGAAERAAGLTRQLLAFSRKQVLAPKVIDLNDALAGMESLLRRVIGEDVELRSVAARDLKPVRVDPNQLGQVILNLAVNARDAMPRGGALSLVTSLVTIDASTPALPAGVYSTVAVTDTGHGMTDEVRARIFEPFFTTKGQGKGTGLGLATAFGIVRQSGGAIEVESTVGAGTRFTIYFPVTEGRPTVGMAPLRSAPAIGSEVVLLVEDESGVRSLVRKALVRSGYQVLEAGDGEHALSVARAHSGSIDLLLSDVVMPRMSGGELLSRVTRERPHMKVLFMSGYTDDMIDQHGIDRDFAFIQKPVSNELLMMKVRAVLDHDAR